MFIDEKMTADRCRRITMHLKLITFSNTEADLVSAFTITYTDEAIGMSTCRTDWRTSLSS